MVYCSQAEAKVAANLEKKQAAGEIKSFSVQPQVELRAYGKHITNYQLDFCMEHNDGTLEYIEVKRGMYAPEFAIKWRLFEAMYEAEHPEIKRTLVRV